MTEPILFTYRSEGTFVDKVVGKENISRLEMLVRKREWTYEDVNTVLYLLTADESKLLNLNPHERYILGKFYAWIREFVKITDDLISQKSKLTSNINTSDPKMLELLDAMVKTMINNVRFLVDIFLFISRTSLSVNGMAFEKLLESRFEYEYSPTQLPMQHQSKTEIKMGR